MTDRRLEQVFSGLETEFEATVARAEDEAASDLAFSLVQDRSLPEALIGYGRVQIRLGDVQLPVTEIAADHVLARNAGGEAVVIPEDQVVAVVAPTSERPARAAISLIERLRDWSRRGATVEVTLREGTLSGRLAATGRDHIVLHGFAGDVVVALGALRAIRLTGTGATGSGAGSADAP